MSKLEVIDSMELDAVSDLGMIFGGGCCCCCCCNGGDFNMAAY